MRFRCNRPGLWLCVSALLSSSTQPTRTLAALASAPVADRSDFVEKLHGISVPDPYRWLEEQWSTDTRQWIGAEVNYSRPLLTNLPSFQRVEKRLREMFNIDQISGIPTAVDGKLYYAK